MLFRSYKIRYNSFACCNHIDNCIIVGEETDKFGILTRYRIIPYRFTDNENLLLQNESISIPCGDIFPISTIEYINDDTIDAPYECYEDMNPALAGLCKRNGFVYEERRYIDIDVKDASFVNKYGSYWKNMKAVDIAKPYL